MKPYMYPLLLLLSSSHVQGYFSFGNSFSTGPTRNSWIREAETTLILPAVNEPQAGSLGLWPGMGTLIAGRKDGHLIQSVAISDIERYNGVCNGGSTVGRWLVRASALTDDDQQASTGCALAKAGDKIRFHYKYNYSTGKIDQTVYWNGKLIATLSTKSGHGIGFGTAMECQMENCGHVPKQIWLNTIITMDGMEPGYGETVGMTGASGDLVTNDGGKTWTADRIVIDAYNFH